MAETVKITVTRAFYIAGETQEVGSTIEVSNALAVELMSYGKAVKAVEKPVKGKKSAPDEKESSNEPV